MYKGAADIVLITKIRVSNDCGLTCNYLGNANGVYRVCRHAKSSYRVCISSQPACPVGIYMRQILFPKSAAQQT